MSNLEHTIEQCKEKDKNENKNFSENESFIDYVNDEDTTKDGDSLALSEEEAQICRIFQYANKSGEDEIESLQHHN